MGSADCLIELDQRPSVSSYLWIYVNIWTIKNTTVQVKLCHDETLKEIEYANSQSDANVLVKLDRMCKSVLHPIKIQTHTNKYA